MPTSPPREKSFGITASSPAHDRSQGSQLGSYIYFLPFLPPSLFRHYFNSSKFRRLNDPLPLLFTVDEESGVSEMSLHTERLTDSSQETLMRQQKATSLPFDC